jgi:hypothetical protein
MNTKISSQNLSILDELKRAVAEERRMMTRVLELLRHVDEGQWFLDMGYPSLFEFCVRELGYAQDAAARRIGAMRLIRDLPILKVKIETGAMNLSLLNEANKFLRAEKRSGVWRTAEQKRELVLGLEGKSKREAERTLIAQAQPETLRELQKQERLRPVSADLTRVNLVITKEQEEKIEKLKSLLSHRNVAGGVVGLLDLLLDEALEKHDPARVESRRVEKLTKKDALLRPVVAAAVESVEAKKDSVASAPSARPFYGGPAGGLVSDIGGASRYIPADVKRAVWLRDGGKCTYENCSSTHFLQYDHHTPYALGGANTLENLRLLCAAHNKAESEKVFGPYHATK